jgi:glycosyltransferase involved in cell wall biosynthesis
MARLLSYSGSKILFVSDTDKCTPKENSTLIIDAEFEHITDEQLINDYIIWNGALVAKTDKLPPKELKVAFISNYRSKCGISTYSEKLYKAIIPYVGDYMVFAEHDDGAPEEEKVIRCWTRGKSIQVLINEIDDYAPDVILIQHEYGLWPDAKIWLSLMTQLSKYKTYVVLHSVYENHDDKTVCEMAIKNIIVHTDIAYKCLTKDKKLSSLIYKISHGCDEPIKIKKPWNMYRSLHTFTQFGFGFRYKGWENSLKATQQLKVEFPDVFFTGVFSESPSNMRLHQTYFEEIMQDIKDWGITENVGFIRGFQPDDLLIKVLMMNRVAVFPYIDNGIHTVFGCSGAARVAMTVGLPVIVTNVPLFDDLEGICPRCNTTDDIIDNLRKFWSDADAYTKQIERQNEFLETNSWNNVARDFVELFSKIS